jgi:signal transduction histidine kinase/CheY-like chemotaxis protein
MDYANVFITVLTTLLAGGCVYYLVRWIYLRGAASQEQQIEALHGLAESVIGTSDPVAVLREVVEICPRLADATHASVWIFDPGRQRLECEASTYAPSTSTVSFNSMSGVVTCFRNRAVTEIPDAENCPFVSQETVRRYRQKALLYVPILADADLVGVIEIEDRKRRRIFTSQQKTRLVRVARLAALALKQRVQTSLKDELHRNEKVAALSELVEGASQELIHPLGKMAALAEPSEDDHVPGLLVARLKAIGREARRASETLARLVKLVRPGRAERNDFDLIELVDSIAGACKQRWKRKGLELKLKLSKNAGAVAGDATQLEEVLVNIFRHAERMVEEQGLRSMEVNSHTLDRSVLVSMGPADLKRVADAADEGESFSDDQDENESALLGLSVCQTLIEKSGGEMTIEHGANRGFSIEIEYPLAAPDTREETPRNGREAPTRPATKSMMALVIDNDPDAQDALLYHLAERGHRVIPVASLEEGLDLSKRVQFDWVYCNIQMGRKSGLDVYRLFQKRVKRFIFLADEEMVIYNRDLFSGNDRALLRKPIKSSEVDRLFEALGVRPVRLREDTATRA